MNVKVFLLISSVVLLHEVNGATVVSKSVAEDLANETVTTPKPEDMKENPKTADNLTFRSAHFTDPNHPDEKAYGDSDAVDPGYGGSEGGKPGYGGSDGGKPGYGGSDGGKPGYGGSEGGKPGYGGSDGGKPGYGGSDGGKPGYGGSDGGKPGYGGSDGGKPGFGGSDGGTTIIIPGSEFEIAKEYKFGQDMSTAGTAQPDYAALSRALTSRAIEIDLGDLSLEDQQALLLAITQLGAAQQQTQNPTEQQDNALIHQFQQQLQQQQQQQQETTGQTGPAMWPGVTYPAQAQSGHGGQSPFNIGGQSQQFIGGHGQHAHHGGHGVGIVGQNLGVQGHQGISFQGVPGTMIQGGQGISIGGQGVGVQGQGVGVGGQGVGIQGQGVGIGAQGVGIQGQGVGIGAQGVGIQGQGVGFGGQGVGIAGQGVGIAGQGVGIGGQQGQYSGYPAGLSGYPSQLEQGLPIAGQPGLSAAAGNVPGDLALKAMLQCLQTSNPCQESVALPTPCDSILKPLGLQTCTQPDPLTGKGVFGRGFHFLKTGVGSIFNYAKTGAQTVAGWVW